MPPNATPRLIGEELWSCPRCHRVTRGIFLVRWCSWLVEFGPAPMCAGCLEELRATGPEVWDVAIVGMRGSPLAPRRVVLA